MRQRVCATTNLPCCYCQPVCEFRVTCEQCDDIKCKHNRKGWCYDLNFDCKNRGSIYEISGKNEI